MPAVSAISTRSSSAIGRPVYFIVTDAEGRYRISGLTPNSGDGYDAVVHFAAESHVDRSILDASDFVRTNVLGTQNLLDWARGGGAARFVQVSTDEVYGSLGETGLFTETTPLAPNSPQCQA